MTPDLTTGQWILLISFIIIGILFAAGAFGMASNRKRLVADLPKFYWIAKISVKNDSTWLEREVALVTDSEENPSEMADAVGYSFAVELGYDSYHVQEIRQVSYESYLQYRKELFTLLHGKIDE